jgi:hypothetical protein
MVNSARPVGNGSWLQSGEDINMPRPTYLYKVYFAVEGGFETWYNTYEKKAQADAAIKDLLRDVTVARVTVDIERRSAK